MSQNLCKWFSKSSKNTIKPDIPDLVQTMSEPVPVPVPVPVPKPRISNKRIIKVYTEVPLLILVKTLGREKGIFWKNGRNISKKVSKK